MRREAIDITSTLELPDEEMLDLEPDIKQASMKVVDQVNRMVALHPEYKDKEFTPIMYTWEVRRTPVFSSACDTLQADTIDTSHSALRWRGYLWL